MSRGNSGRIVLEIDPLIKDNLYVALAKKRLTLKDWFLDQCCDFIETSKQPRLFDEIVAEKQSHYLGKNES